MRVWFVAAYEQDDSELEPYGYDNMMDSPLYVSEERAAAEAERLYSEALNRAAESYERRVARWQARQDAKSILDEKLWSELFPYGEEQFPTFEVPTKRPVYWLDVE